MNDELQGNCVRVDIWLICLQPYNNHLYSTWPGHVDWLPMEKWGSKQTKYFARVHYYAPKLKLVHQNDNYLSQQSLQSAFYLGSFYWEYLCTEQNNVSSLHLVHQNVCISACLQLPSSSEAWTVVTASHFLSSTTDTDVYNVWKTMSTYSKRNNTHGIFLSKPSFVVKEVNFTKTLLKGLAGGSYFTKRSRHGYALCTHHYKDY